MGELVHLDDRRRRRRVRAAVAAGGDAPRVKLYVDLADPFSYLAAERVERAFPRVAWRLASQASLDGDRGVVLHTGTRLVRQAAERRAAELRLPLQWPDRFPEPVPGAMRAAAVALGLGRGGAFILAAGRLAFGGGFDLDDPEILMEAAAAAGLPLDVVLEAARDPRLDGPIEAAGRRLLELGADHVPALRVEGKLLFTEGRISAYMASGAHAAAALAAERNA